MNEMEFDALLEIARGQLNPRQTARECEVGHVACALVTAGGNVYTGVAFTLTCALGACAEFSAVAQMLGGGESQAVRVATLHEDGTILPPCGRCRELFSQVDAANLICEFLVADNEVMTLTELLPKRWDAYRD